MSSALGTLDNLPLEILVGFPPQIPPAHVERAVIGRRDEAIDVGVLGVMHSSFTNDGVRVFCKISISTAPKRSFGTFTGSLAVMEPISLSRDKGSTGVSLLSPSEDRPSRLIVGRVKTGLECPFLLCERLVERCLDLSSNFPKPPIPQV